MSSWRPTVAVPDASVRSCPLHLLGQTEDGSYSSERQRTIWPSRIGPDTTRPRRRRRRRGSIHSRLAWLLTDDSKLRRWTIAGVGNPDARAEMLGQRDGRIA